MGMSATPDAEGGVARSAHLQRGKVDYAVDLGVLLEDFVESRLVGDVHLVEGGALAGDELNAVDAFFGGVVKVVDDDHAVACVQKSNDGKRANVSAATMRGGLVGRSDRRIRPKDGAHMQAGVLLTR